MCNHEKDVFLTEESGQLGGSLLTKRRSLDSNITLTQDRGLTPSTTAALLMKVRAIRAEQAEPGSVNIDDTAWHILLDLMVHSNSDRAMTANDLAAAHAVPESTMVRYVEYLTSIDMVDKMHCIGSNDPMLLTLSNAGFAYTSKVLTKIGRVLNGA